ncbi:MAG: adenylate/guanylate cyclase domain-containing protein [Spirochaetes bacterium]|nr:adenylate/guanylate cyclase domain-containing protein [Spirochaetota bacterium]
MSIISLIIITSLSGMIILASFFFRRDTEVRIEEMNLNIAEITSSKVQVEFSSIIDKLNLMGTTLIQQFRSREQQDLFTNIFFRNDKSIVFVGVAEREGEGLDFRKTLFNSGFMENNKFSEDDMASITRKNGSKLVRAFNNQVVVENVSSDFKMPVIAVVMPFQKAGNTVQSVVCSYMKLDRFLQTFRKTGDIRDTFMVNDRGDVLAHPDGKIVLSHGNLINLPIVKMMLESRSDNGQTRYKDLNGVYHIGAFKKIGLSGIGVIATVEEARAFQAVYDIQRRNIYIMVIVLTLAILIVYFFGKTLTTPIVRLVGATKEIEQGNFRVNIVPASGDEIGQLTSSFIAMGRGLEEREKLKETFGKFVNKEIAERVLKGEIKLGGERVDAAIFFSDIRSFTAISEKLQPEEVVEFLNQYMTRMVNCVNRTFGVVDKYIGDAIMAVWGAPISKGNDTENAINGALMMRKELMEFNKGRGGEKKPIIKIGCGINSGPVLAGQIGSEDRMEYTVIGDTVNLASRIESLNKPFGTDILISSDSYGQVRNIYRVEPMQKIKVKGKTEPQQIYAVLGRADDQTAPRSLEDLRRILGIEMKGKPQGETEEEVKYEILE